MVRERDRSVNAFTPRRTPGALLLWLLMAGSLLAQTSRPQPRRFARERLQMGTRFELVVYGVDEAKAAKALEAAHARIAALNGVFSDWDPESELMRRCRAARPGKVMPASETLVTLLARAQDFAKLSDGAFDVTVGPFTRLWRRSRQLGQLPPKAVLDEARARVGWRQLKVDPEARTLRLDLPRMRLDLGGIAKGAAADEALRCLREAGFPRALVDAGGDLRLGDPPPGRRGWTIAVRSLAKDEKRAPLVLADCAVATSGDLERSVTIDGVSYSHLIDPRTGLGLTRRRAATVIAPDATTADALASVVCVLGGEGLALLRGRPGVEGELWEVVEGKRSRVATRGFPRGAPVVPEGTRGR